MRARLARWLVASLPPRFRRRYGAELGATLEAHGVSSAVVADLARTSAREWLAATFAPAGTAEAHSRHVVVVAFGASVAAVVSLLVFARAVDDHPVTGLTGWALRLFNVGSTVVLVGGLATAAVGLAFWAVAVRQALVRRDRVALVAAVRPAATVAGWLGLVWLVGRGAHAPIPSTGLRVAALAFLGVTTLLAVAWCVRDVVRTFERTHWSPAQLRAALVVARAGAALVDLVAGIASVVAVRVLLVGRMGAWSTTLTIASTGAVLAASLVATGVAARRVRPTSRPAA